MFGFFLGLLRWAVCLAGLLFGIASLCGCLAPLAKTDQPNFYQPAGGGAGGGGAGGGMSQSVSQNQTSANGGGVTASQPGSFLQR